MPALPSSELTVGLELLDARGFVQLDQLPAAANDFTTVVEFDDDLWAGSDFYRVRLMLGSRLGTDKIVR